MPFVETNKLANVMDPPDPTPTEDINDVDNEAPAFWGETIPAAFRTTNSIVSELSTDRSFEEENVNYNPNIEGYEDFATSFSTVFSKESELATKRNIDKQIEDRKTISDSGWLGIAASFAAGIIDPVNLIPVGGAASKVFKTGYTLKGALSTARSALVGGTIAEVALHQSQETRTLGESAANITAGALLGGVLGGASAAFKGFKSAKTVRQIESDINNFLTIPEEGIPDLIIGQGIEKGSVGSAARFLDPNKIKPVAGLEKLDVFSPVQRTLTSPNIKTKQNVIELAEVSYILDKNTRGVATEIAIETKVKSLEDVSQFKLFNITSEAFSKHRGQSFNKARTVDKLGLGKENLNFDQFKIEIDKAMRRNDFSEIPEVADAAKKLRVLVDDIYNEAVSLGLATKVEGGPLGAPSWMRRIYDKQSIHSNRSNWNGKLRNWFVKKNPELERVEIDDLIQRTTDNILGRPEDLPIFQLNASGAFKERVFDIPDELIQDFLIQDIDVVLSGYFKKGIREIELKKGGFDNDGLRIRLEDMTQQSIQDLRKVRSKIKSEFKPKKDAAKNDKELSNITEKENKELAKADKESGKTLERDKKNITGMRDRIRGTFELNSQQILNTDKFTDTLKSLNYTRLLGQVALSSIPDIGMPILINGMTRALKDQLVPFVRNIGKITKELGKIKKTSVHAQSIQELRDMGVALELILNTRVKNFAELGSSVTGSKLTAFNASTTKTLSYLSGITVWNDKLKLISGYSAMSRILRASQSKKSLSGSDTEFLARFGIDKTSLKRIGSEFKTHGIKENGRWASGSNNWTDREAYSTFQNSIRKFVDQTIIVPGQEKPFLMSTTWGSVFLQFKSFALSSYSKLFLAGLQQRDLAALNGAVTMVSLGMLSFALKKMIAGRDLPEDIPTWLKEGVDKSGLLGHLFDANEILAKAGAGISDGPISRYKSRSGASAVAGPSYGLIEDAFSTGNWIRNFMQGERPAESDIHATRRIIPFQNVVILRKLFDLAEDGIISAVGATKSKKKTKTKR